MLKFVLSFILGFIFGAWLKSRKPKIIKIYKPISNRCWVCGELSKINCPGYHTLEQKKLKIKHYKELGYTDGIPSIHDTKY